MSARHTLAFLTILASLLAAASAVTAQPAPSADRVEAKWGDAWLPAAVLKRDAGKVLVRFDDGVQKWLPAIDTRPVAKPAGGPGQPAATKPAPAPAGPLAVGAAVEAKWFDRWERATIVKREGNRIYVKYDRGLQKWVTPAEIRPAKPLDTSFLQGLKVGDRLEVKWGARWWTAAVVATEPGRVKIHYENHGDAFDEWVSSDRIRPLPAGEPASAGGTPTPAGATPENSTLPTFPPGDTSSVRQIDLTADIPYTAKADPAPAASAPLNLPPNIPLNLKLATAVPRESVARVLFTQTPAPTAWAVINSSEFFEKPQQSRIQRVHLGAGRATDLVQLPPNRLPLDVSPDGSLIVARARHREKDSDRLVRSAYSAALEVLRVQANGPASPVTTWQLTAEWPQYVSGAAFVDNEHLLTWMNFGSTTLWRIPKGDNSPPKAVYTIGLSATMPPTFSPGGKTFAAIHGTRLAFFDALTGASLGAVADFNVSAGGASAAFKPDGILLAVASTQRVSIINVPGGKVLREIPIPAPYVAHTSVDWVASNHLLLGRRYLIDIVKRVITWEYLLPHGNLVSAFHAGRVWFPTGGEAASLASSPIPHDAALNAQTTVNADDLLVLKPGVKATIELNTGAPEDVRQKIQKSLEQQLRARGVEVADNQPLRITATSSDENSRQVQYRLFGGGVQSATVSDKVHTLTITLDGAEVWKNTAKFTPSSFVTTKKDQTIEDAIRATQEQSYGTLASMPLPQFLAKPTEYPIAGRSSVSEKGLQPAPPKQPQ